MNKQNITNNGLDHEMRKADNQMTLGAIFIVVFAMSTLILAVTYVSQYGELKAVKYKSAQKDTIMAMQAATINELTHDNFNNY